MRTSRKYLIAVSLLAVLAVMFGVFGTVAPPLAEEGLPVQPQQEPPSESVGHFQNPPSYDSWWVDISTKPGQYVTLKHDLNTTDVVVDVSGRMSLDPMSGALAWSKTYGETSSDGAYSSVLTSDGGYALAGGTDSFGAGGTDFWLVKTDSAGRVQWSRTYGGVDNDLVYSLVQTSDGGYAMAGYTRSYSVGASDFWLVKTDSAGNALWNQSYGGTNIDAASSVVQTGDGGYAIAGYTNSSGAGFDFWLIRTDSAGNLQWDRTYGGTSNDVASSLIQTNDGGYAITGHTDSVGAGSSDIWLVKTDADGFFQWGITYGGTNIDAASSVVQTGDGGYAITGYTSSYGAGGFDFWLVKTDIDGIQQWSQTYGGAGFDSARSLVQTGDGGYAIAGYTDSFGAGYFDAWLVKTDSAGIMQWSRAYGGPSAEYASSLVQTGDGGYAIAGSTGSYGAGNYDFWLVKVKGDMNLEHKKHLGGTNLLTGWSRTYGGAGADSAFSAIQTRDGGYALAGYTGSFGAGTYDFWLVKTDAGGNVQWNRTYGGAGAFDVAYSIVQTADGGYALAGYTNSYGAGDSDFWLIKTDSAGIMLWSRTYGGTSTDIARSLVQTNDGGYALAGYTGSFGAGNYDLWLVKTDSAGNFQWGITYGGTDADYAHSLVQTGDGGYAIAGSTGSYGAGSSADFWLVKTDSSGLAQWNRTYGGIDHEIAYSAVQTGDGGYALAGYTWFYGAGGTDFWLVKTDATGNVQWSRTYGGAGDDAAYSMVRTSDEGYAIAGQTHSFGAVSGDSWLVKTDLAGRVQWSRAYGAAGSDSAFSVVQTDDGGYALAGYTPSYGAGYDFWLVRSDIESGLAQTGLTSNSITLYRGSTDLYWNYVRVRIWIIKEPSWIYGDINMDGIVDAKDLYIIGRNYGKTFSLLSLTGIIAVAGIRTVRKRKDNKQPSYIS